MVCCCVIRVGMCVAVKGESKDIYIYIYIWSTSSVCPFTMQCDWQNTSLQNVLVMWYGTPLNFISHFVQHLQIDVNYLIYLIRLRSIHGQIRRLYGIQELKGFFLEVAHSNTLPQWCSTHTTIFVHFMKCKTSIPIPQYAMLRQKWYKIYHQNESCLFFTHDHDGERKS